MDSQQPIDFLGKACCGNSYQNLLKCNALQSFLVYFRFSANSRPPFGNGRFHNPSVNPQHTPEPSTPPPLRLLQLRVEYLLAIICQFNPLPGGGLSVFENKWVAAAHPGSCMVFFVSLVFVFHNQGLVLSIAHAYECLQSFKTSTCPQQSRSRAASSLQIGHSRSARSPRYRCLYVQGK